MSLRLNQKFLEQQPSNPNSKHWNPFRQKKYIQLWNFINKKGKWQNIKKQFPDILVFLLCNYADNLKLQKWIKIVKILNQKVQELDKNWYGFFYFGSKISLTEKQAKQVNDKKTMLQSNFEIEVEQIKPQPILKKIVNQQTNDKSIPQEKWILYEEINFQQVYGFKKSEQFKNIEDKLEDCLNSEKDEQKQHYINQLKEIFLIMKNKKKNHEMKKTIDFNKKIIRKICRSRLIKMQVDYFKDEIKKSPSQLFEYISTIIASNTNNQNNIQDLDKQLKLLFERCIKKKQLPKSRSNIQK